MKSWLLQLLASAALKQAVAQAFAVAVLIADALRGILEGGNLSAESRFRLDAVLKAVVSVRDFLARLKVLFGVPEVVEGLGAGGSANRLQEAATKLRQITEGL